MAKLTEIFENTGITFYQNECNNLDNFYPEPYQDDVDQTGDSFQMIEPFETDKSIKIRRIQNEQFFSLFSFFMDGSRKTYKIGDLFLPTQKKIFPVIVAQVVAGCIVRDRTQKDVHCQDIKKENFLLLTSEIAKDDFADIKESILNTTIHKDLEIAQYSFKKQKDTSPTNAAISCANSQMHKLEISILKEMVTSKILNDDSMLVVDGPLQFVFEDTRDKNFADLFYNVIGVSKSFDPLLPMQDKKGKGQQIGNFLLSLEYSQRTPVFFKKNDCGRKFGCWYLRIRPKSHVKGPLEGIIKIEKMANQDDIERDGLDTDVVDNICRSLLNECSPTCHGNDDRWASHLYAVYLAETMIKNTFISDEYFVNQFRRNL